MSKDDVIEAEGVIEEALPNATFKVKLTNGFVITAYISGKLRMNYIKIIFINCFFIKRLNNFFTIMFESIN